MSDDPNRREFTRVALRIQAKFESDGFQFGPVEIRDVSLNGICLLTTAQVPLGTACRVVVFLGAADNAVEIRTRGSVVRTDGHSVGVEIDAIEGEDSFEHLRNLVLYNAPDVDAVEAEFRAHVGLRRPS